MAIRNAIRNKFEEIDQEILKARLMNPSLEVVGGKVARGALLLRVVRLLVADEGDQVRRLVVAEAALEDVGATAFGLHHFLDEIYEIRISVRIRNFPISSSRAQKNAVSTTRIQN